MPPTGMRTSPSEKDLSKLTQDSYSGTDAILESPDEFSHEQDKSPLSDSGFETRSEKTPSAPQSAESTGPKPPFTDVPIPPVITETRTEVVHVIRSFEHPEEVCEPLMEEAAAFKPPVEPEPLFSSVHDKVKAVQMKVCSEELACVKEETHITTTTRMVYHKPQLKDAGSDLMEGKMSVQDIMKAFQSGRDPSKEFAGLFEHKAGLDTIKGDELSQRFLEKDKKPKVERIIEVHIEKGNTMDPTEVIIREAKKHPEFLSKSDRGLRELTDGDYEVLQDEEELAAEETLPGFLDSSRVNTPVSQEEESRPSSAQLIADESYKALKLLSQQSIEYHDDEQSEIRGETYRFAEKMLHSENLDLTHSDNEESVNEQTHGEGQRPEGLHGKKFPSSKKEPKLRSSRDASDKSSKYPSQDEQFDKVTVLHYSTDPGSPKHAVWMRFTQDRQERNREKLIYEDRVDRTIKEAEEKLSEVSQFFRDKTEKLNDELQSPEKKKPARVSRETHSGPSSVNTSPVKKQQTTDDELEKGRQKIFGCAKERKCASLPSSPEKQVKTGPPVPEKTSRVSTFRQKFETETQKQDKDLPVKKLPESKLPVYQFFAGSKTSKVESTTEAQPPTKRTQTDKSKVGLPGQVSPSTTVSKQFGDKPFLEKSSTSVSVAKRASLFEKLNDQNDWKENKTDALPRDNINKSDTQMKTLKKKTESHIPVRTSSDFSDSIQSKNMKLETSELSPSQRPTKTRVQGRSELQREDPAPKKQLEATGTSSVDKIVTVTTRESFKGLKTLPVYVSVQIGKSDKDTGGEVNGASKKISTTESRTVYAVRQKQPTSPQASPDDDTLEQFSFIDSSGKSPMTPDTPSSEEVSYDLTSRNPDPFISFLPAITSPIAEVSEESEDSEQCKVVSFKEPNLERESKVKPVTCLDSKEKRVAYIEFPPPPPLDFDSSQPEKKGSTPSSEAETEIMEVIHEKKLLPEPIIRVQPPSPVPPGADDSDSSEEESIFKPIPVKKYTFKIDEDIDIKKSQSIKHDTNGNSKEPGTNGNGKVEDYDYEQNGNDQSITDCSIATTAEFSHDTDATEIDSLDGYELQDEDDGLSEPLAKPFGFPNENRKDIWASDNVSRPSDRCQSKLEAIQEESPVEDKTKAKNDPSDKKNGKDSERDGKPSGQGLSESYFSYKLDEEFHTPFKTVATKGFDPWSSKGGEDEVVNARIKDDEPRPFALAVDEKSSATTPDTTPARTPTDESTPTSEPNPFPFHEGKMFEMTRSGAIDMSKRDCVEERLQFFQIGPQTPCERTDLRMAIVADHLGLSWTEMAREMEFSVDEINQIRVENPNSLTAQSFMLLKKWVGRDGKNATTDALAAVLSKINRLDIVTLLEGPIFDYGNISGTRCFADDSAVSQEQADGFHNIELELQSPTELNYEPPTPLRHDDFFSEDSSLTFPSSSPVRPSELSLPSTSNPMSADTKPPTVKAEDTTIGGRESLGQEDGSAEENQELRKGTDKDLDVFPRSPSAALAEESGMSGFDEESEEMTQDKIKSLLESINLEEGSEDEEMTEERLQAILSGIQQAENEMSSISGLQGETSGAIANTETRTENQRQTEFSTPAVQAERQNGQHPGDDESSSKLKGKGSTVDKDEASCEALDDRGPKEKQEEPTIQEARRDNQSSSDEEETVTTRVFRRRVILKGDQAKNIPAETVTEEQFTDEDGNIVIRKVVRRSAAPEEKGKRKRGKRSRQANRAEPEDEKGPKPQREPTEILSGDIMERSHAKGSHLFDLGTQTLEMYSGDEFQPERDAHTNRISWLLYIRQVCEPHPLKTNDSRTND
ncbi:hypothetical protein DNTS_014192 [Danionella cerebrum]|uniref:Death domain-containing protein n=1 Tax=Danionella cerebrum TaxID=2873325 RepID=A0A553MY86_9TELE|nr:hypothetical protein DNTS_014192 [Danionella translucida]